MKGLFMRFLAWHKAARALHKVVLALIILYSMLIIPTTLSAYREGGLGVAIWTATIMPVLFYLVIYFFIWVGGGDD